MLSKFFSTLLGTMIIIMGLFYLPGYMQSPIITSTADLIVDDDGQGDHTTIQSAIDNADEGDTIFIWAGTYNENIIVNKEVALVGNSTSNTTIQGVGIGHVVKVTANGANISALRIINSGSGLNDSAVIIESANNCLIESCHLSNNNNGISIINSSNDKVNNCTVEGSTHIGIKVFNSTSVEITNDTVFGNDVGIQVDGVVHPQINGCKIYSNTCGITFLNRAYATALQNDIYSNTELGMNNTDPQDALVDATDNWWGHSSGPNHPVTNIGGQGNGVSDGVTFTPWNASKFRNAPPMIISEGHLSAVEDKMYLFNITFENDGDDLQWLMVTNTGGWLAIDQVMGQLSGIPTNLDVGFQWWVNISVDDGIQGTDTQNFTLEVINTPPVIETQNLLNATEDIPYERDYDSSDDDSGKIDWALYTSSNASWLRINTTSGYLNGTPRNDDVGTYYVNVSCRDGHNGEAWSNFTLTVLNAKPQIVTPNTLTATEGTYYQVDYNSTDDSVSQPIRDTSWTLTTDSDWLNIDEVSGVLHGIPFNDHVGQSWVNVTVDDGHGASDFTNFTITVENKEPMITLKDHLTSTEDILYSVDCFSDEEGMGNVTWYLETNASFLSIDPGNGYLNGTPNNTHIGTFWVKVIINDGNGGSEDMNFTLTVVNAPPKILTEDATTAVEDSLYSVDYNCDDDGQGNVSWDLETTARWLSIDPLTGILSGTPTNAHVRKYQVRVSVDDGNGGTAASDFELTVLNTPASILTRSPPETTPEDKYYLYDFNSSDDGSGTIIWDLATNATWLTINSTTGVIEGTPTNEHIDIFNVNVSCKDGLSTDFVLTSYRFSLRVINTDPVVIPKDLDANMATVGVPYEVDYDCSDDGQGTMTWSLETDAQWLSINPTTGLVSGTPSEVGSSFVTVSVADGNGGTGTESFTLTVDQPMESVLIKIGPIELFDEPLEGAEVTISLVDTRAELYEGLTGSDGYVRIDVPSYWLGLNVSATAIYGHSEHGELSVVWIARLPDEPGGIASGYIPDLSTSIAQPLIPIKIGPFKDDNNRPIENIRVTIIFDGEEYISDTDENGYASFELPPGIVGEDVSIKTEWKGRTAIGTITIDDDQTTSPPEGLVDALTRADAKDDEGLSQGNIITIALIIICFLIFLALMANLGTRRHRLEEITPEPKRLKRVGVSEGDLEKEYECPACGASFHEFKDECPECGAEFEGTEDEDKEYECPECGAGFAEQVDECPECGVAFSGLVHEDDEEYECPECGAGFAEEVEKCPDCGAEFGGVDRDDEDTGGDEEFECPECGAGFKEEVEKCPECGAEFGGVEDDEDED